MDQWDKIENKNNKKMLDVSRRAMFTISRNIIKRSPVDLGRFINNWFPQLGSPSTEMTDDVDKTGGAALASTQKTVNAVKFGHVFYFINNLPYALALEFGHSKVKAPAGMVRVSLADYQNIVDREVKAIKND